MHIFQKTNVFPETKCPDGPNYKGFVFLKTLSFSLGALFYLCKPFLQREKEFYQGINLARDDA